jgi:hypothetical protein
MFFRTVEVSGLGNDLGQLGAVGKIIQPDTRFASALSTPLTVMGSAATFPLSSDCRLLKHTD